MTDPKPYTLDELQYFWVADDGHTAVGATRLDRLLATARAAAEADSLRARLDKLQAFKDYVHQRLDAAGVPADPEADKNAEHGCRIEGRLNFVEATAAALRAQLEEARKALADFQELKRNKCPTHAGARVACGQCHDSLKQHLTTAQGEVAVLREALAERLECQDDKVNEEPFTIHDGDGYADLVRNERTRKTINAGFAALASTRATAAAHDERVRREALEERLNIGDVPWGIRESLRMLRAVHRNEVDPITREQIRAFVEANEHLLDEALRALAHPTKEPKPQ